MAEIDEKKQRKKVKKIEKNIETATKNMHDNIDKVLTRGELLEDLNKNTKTMQNKAQIYNAETKAMANRLRFKNISITSVIIGAIVGGAFGLLTFSSTPFILLYAVVGGFIGYGVSWAANSIYQALPSWPFKGWFGSKDQKLTQEKSKLTAEPALDNQLSASCLATPSPDLLYQSFQQKAPETSISPLGQADISPKMRVTKMVP